MQRNTIAALASTANAMNSTSTHSRLCNAVTCNRATAVTAATRQSGQQTSPADFTNQKLF